MLARSLASLFLVAAVAALVSIASATATAATPLQVTLVSSQSAVQPGQPFYVGLQLQHRKGYHSYWKFPGIVGVPTGVKWALPPGWKASEILWPEPERVHMFEIEAQGYHGEVTLPIQITPPKDLKVVPGHPITLSGKVSWMCCGRDCNPGFTDVTLQLPAAEPGAPPPVGTKWTKDISQALASRPTSLQGWKVEATRQGADKIELKLTAQTPDAQQKYTAIKDTEVIFFTDDGLINPDEGTVISRPAADTLLLELTISEYATHPKSNTLTGIVQVPTGWSGATGRSGQIRIPIR